MKKKGLILAIFFGTIMLTSLAAGVFLNRTPPKIDNAEDTQVTLTGTPADNFPDVQRARFCGSGDAKSTMFVKEYTIPTVCTNPLAIVTDHDGNVWFAETNTGKLGKFDPTAQSFTEFDNPLWPKKGRSMMWGIDYSPDGTLWYTDESYDSIWRFSINDQKYQRLQYPSDGNTLPQKLKVDGSQIVINDFTGNKITFLDPAQSDENLRYISLPSPINGTVTSDFAVDSKNNVWYTNWLYQQGGGVLVKFDQESYRLSLANAKESPTTPNYFEVFQLPPEMLTPNGLTISNDVIWLADTSSSAIFSFDPATQQFTQFVTSNPKLSTYGNSTGVIKSPISRPYWIESNPAGQIIFNEQTSNSIAVMDPKTLSLVEYLVPSKNPEWGDCSGMDNCGLAQIFDFTVNDNKIWFTEWAENNIGVVDTSIELPFEIQLNSTNISLKPGESKNVSVAITPKTTQLSDASLISTVPYNFMNVTSNNSGSFQLNSNDPKTIGVTISISAESIPGEYKVLLGAQTEDVSVSKFVTVTIEP